MSITALLQLAFKKYFGTYSMCAWDWGSLWTSSWPQPQMLSVCAQEFHDARMACAMQNFAAAVLVSFEQLSDTGQYSQPRQQPQIPFIVSKTIH